MKQIAKFILILIICLSIHTFLSAQTYNVTGITQNAASTTIGGNCVVTVSGTPAGGSVAWQGSAIATPGLNGSTGDQALGCTTYSGMRLEMTASASWGNSITVTLTFTTPVQAPVSFNIYDLTEPLYSGDNSAYYQDKVTIGALDNVGTPIIPTATISGAVDNTVVGNNRVLTANVMNGQCQNQVVSVGTGCTLVKSVTITYSNQNPPTHAPGGKYGLSQYQYVYVSNINYTTPPSVTLTPSPATVCLGNTSTLTATAGFTTYAWSSGGSGASNTTTLTPGALGVTTYTVTATNASGCTATATANVTASNPTTPTFTAVGPYCSGAAIPALPTTSTNGITGTWSPAINNTATTLYTFTPTAGLCANTTTMTITVNPNTTPTFAAVGPYCSGSVVPALPTTSTNGITGTWSPAINNTATTLYTFTPTAGLCATTTTLTITITPNTTPTFSASGPYCSGDAIPALPTTSTNGVTGTWSPAINNTATTVYTFTPTAGLCATTTTLTITVNPILTPTFAAVGPYCSGATIPALPTTSTNGVTGTWAPALSNTATTLYTFTPTAGLCATITTLTITINPNITPTFAAVGPYCSGASIAALPTTSTNGITGTWSPAISNTATTVYTFTPTAGLCATTTTLTITVNPNITPTFAAVGSYCSGASIADLPTTSTNGITGTWSPAISNTATTVYTFTPTAGLCATTTTLTITVNPNITPTFAAVGPYCSGASIAALPTTSTNGITGTWSPAIDNANTTVYTFTPTPGLCATTTTLTITIGSNITPTFATVGPYCSGAVIPALPTTSANGYTGSWLPAIDNTTTTTYTFTPTVGQCATTTTLTISIDPTITPTFAAVGPYCSGAAIPALPTTSTNGITGTWSPAIDNANTTIYTFTPTAGQCATTANSTINITPKVDPAFVSVGPYCEGSSADILPSTSTNSISGTWNPTAINTNLTGITVYTFTPSAGECANNATMPVTVNANILPVFDQLGPYCEGSASVAFTTVSNNGINGTWDQANVNTAVSGTTTYTFTPTAGQCALAQTMDVTIGTNVLPAFTSVAPICASDAIAPLPTTSNNGFTGVWSPAPDNTQTTIYTFVPDAGQCAVSTTLTINVNPIFTPSFDAIAPVCNGTTLSPLPVLSNNGVTGSWLPALDNSQTTTYTFTPDAGQCAVSTTLTIQVDPNISPIFTPVADICAGTILNPLPILSDNGINGTWSPALNNTQTTTYTFTPDAGLCATTTTMTITVNPLITPVFTAVNPICNGENLSPLPLTSDNSIVGSWSPALNNTQTTTYTFTPDAGQCADITTMTIVVNQNETPTIIGNTSICQGQSTTLDAGGPYSSYLWSPAATTQIIEVNTSGTYAVTVTNTSGCTGTANTTVTLNALPDISVDVPQTITCLNTSVSLSATSNATDAIWLWSAGVVPGNTNNGTASNAGTYTVQVTDNTTGCSNSSSVDVLSNIALPNVTVNSSDEITCNVDTVTVTANSTSSDIIWSWTGTGNVTPANASNGTVISPGVYYIVVTDTTNDCFATDSVIVTQNTVAPDLALSAPSQLNCSTTQMNLSANSTLTGLTYVWTGPGIVSGDSTATPLINQPGTYYITATNPSNGCVSTADLTIVSNTIAPEITSGTLLPIDCYNLTVNVSVTTSANSPQYFWSGAGIISGNTTNQVSVNAEGAYSVTVTDDNGCSSSMEQTVIRGNLNGEIVIRNVFSPNADGINDYWEVDNLMLYPENQLTIINRWGNEVYTMENYQNNWDGSDLSEGTYYYLLKVKLCGEDKTFNGYITILR